MLDVELYEYARGSMNVPGTVGWSCARRSIGGNMSAPTASGTNRDTLDEVDALVADGRALYAIDLLEHALATDADDMLERRLASVRYEAFA